ncbi:MAG: dTDP-glucose 4,6-dehydratase [Candidatus Levybacteria bacterium RIFCSPHIGHO2_12_FULL_38_12]|nr:MAG: dTDP-glucose 4,6-dehydratase [Candidatus Levybacteria bacterium RIFCSPHIGHO2_01_FULL_38_12]OGH21892.1 MAG: dTDP-glucose 4,6-dehydratase [Candidatus Levybacteria bacterium RIFCSPHIGHO2_02_FULL_37_18]OGH22824.1 MAG: dTDP-glucose 4,6-dehydratase [Candidatus Levybacteria bacterium RIFCSPHIGHO2_12_FULL_38_12]OGH33549.1 MAG: dTDP-glucose 4,6-dehydratase [Candidatus Levybacteria bacterium RIFCSPLOWO2_01_FULL_37_20]OGH44470.1 MAG: dTDP-glucose 4,6-dehydratase [Candidatus Levybacteria bacterium 
MKILVTGGAGFIGSNFILYWLKNHPDDFVVNLDKLTYAGNLENLKEVEGNPNYSFFYGDICEGSIVDKAMEEVDVVVHFAAESHVDRSILDPSIFIKTNVLGTQVLLEQALKHKVKRFHHISTDEVFGSLKLEDPSKFNDRTPYNPRSPYSASKAGADHLVRSYFTTYGLPITMTNCADNFGPFQFPEKLISLAITNLLEGKRIPIYGDGLYVRDWLYVEDHCRAIETILKKGKIGETYLIGSTIEEMNNLTVIKKILKYMGKDENYVEFVKDRPGHDRRYAVDWSKIKKEIGWKPMHSFDKTLKQTIEWYTLNEDWWKRIKNGEYKEYYKKQYGEI